MNHLIFGQRLYLITSNKYFNYLVLLFLFTGCNQSTNDSKVSEIELKAKAEANVDSRVKEITRNLLFDTVGEANAPLKIISAQLFRQKYSNYKDIRLKIKNMSSKRISAARFKWYGENAFGEPADMGGISIMKGSEGFGGGFTETEIGPGKSTTLEWGIYSKDGKKVIKAWATEVVFNDGTKWKSSSR